jgi:hypothetical protein
MAGFDRFDPAIGVFCGAAHVDACAGLRMAAERAANLIDKRQRAS